MPFKKTLPVAGLSVIIITALSLEVWAMSLAPIAVVQPIFQAAEMVIPTLTGLFIFKEIKDMSLRNKITIGIGLIGGLLIAVSF